MPCKMARSPSDRKVYIGDLSRDVRRKELEEICGEYGRVRDCWVARNPPGFAFVEFDDARDAADTVRELNGRKICGRRVNAKLYMEKITSRTGLGRPPPPDEKCYECRVSGHYARDCRSRQKRPRRERSHSRDRSPSYRASPSRYSRSNKRRYSRSRSNNRDYHRSRSSPDRYRRKESPRRRSPSKSPRRSRSYSIRRSYPSPSERRAGRPRSPSPQDNRDRNERRASSRSKSSSRSRGRRSRSPSTKHNDSESPNYKNRRSSSTEVIRKRSTPSVANEWK